MRVTSAAVGLVLLWAAGCGGSEDTFPRDYNRAVRPISELGRHPGAQPKDYEALARRTERTRENLARLEAPDDLRDELAGMRGVLGRVTGDLESVARTIRAKDPVPQRRAARRLEDSIDAFRRAENALHRAIRRG